MADLRLSRIEIRNWMTVRTADITFPEKGLILVIGSNLAADGKLQSVGSGKTALGEALSRALVGVDGRFSNLGHFAPDGNATNSFVKISAQLLDKPLTVEMGYKCAELSRTGEGLRFTYGAAEPVQRGHVDRTREELSKTLRVTPELANWTVFLDGDKLKFNRLSQEDSVNLLMTALAQPPWTEYYELVGKKLQSANRQVAISRQSLDAAKAWVDRCEEDVEDAKQDYEAARGTYERQLAEQAGKIEQIKKQNSADKGAITAAEESLLSLKKKLKVLEDQHAESNHELEIRRQAFRDSLAETDQAWLVASEKRSALNTELQQYRTQHSQMLRVPKSCPQCGKPWDKAHSEEELAKARVKIEKSESAWRDAGDAFEVWDEKRRKTNASILALEKQMRENGHTADVQHIGELYERNERMIKNLLAGIHQRELQIAELQRGVDATFVNKRQAVIVERQRALEARQKEVQTAAGNLAADEEVVKIVAYWYRAYSPTGIPNMVLTDAIPPLNRVAQRISSLMTGGTICVTYSTTSTLASGENRPKLVTKVENKIGSRRMEGSSKGEAGLTNLIIAENLNEIGQVSQRVGFRWYDEITSGQDSVVRRSIFAYLKDVANRLGILIFVVDHHVEAASYADHVLVAEKSIAGGTRYFWR